MIRMLSFVALLFLSACFYPNGSVSGECVMSMEVKLCPDGSEAHIDWDRCALNCVEHCGEEPVCNLEDRERLADINADGCYECVVFSANDEGERTYELVDEI